MRAFEVIYRADVKNEVIEAETVSWVAGWVIFTSGEYVHMAYPSDIVYAVMELEGTDE